MVPSCPLSIRNTPAKSASCIVCPSQGSLGYLDKAMQTPGRSTKYQAEASSIRNAHNAGKHPKLPSRIFTPLPAKLPVHFSWVAVHMSPL